MNNKVYEQIVNLTNQTRDSFKNRGMAIPTSDGQGNIKIGKYTIIYNKDGNYQINDHHGQTFYKNINLPQTAILIANALATKQRVDDRVLRHDQTYGTKMFDDINYTRLSKIYLKQHQLKKYLDMSMQSDYAADQANRARDAIIKTYKKLFQLH